MSSGKQVQLRSSAARRSKPPRKTQRNGTSRRGKPWRLLRGSSALVFGGTRPAPAVLILRQINAARLMTMPHE